MEQSHVQPVEQFLAHIWLLARNAIVMVNMISVSVEQYYCLRIRTPSNYRPLSQFY